jgi:hypothetical protein
MSADSAKTATAVIDDDAIEVSSATQTEEEMRVSLGMEAPAAGDTTVVGKAAPKADEKGAPAAKPDQAAPVAGEDDEPPQAGETPEQKTAREGRNKTRGEKRLGQFQTQIDTRRRELGDIDREIARKRDELAKLTAPPAEKKDGQPPAAAPASAPAEDVFSFEAFAFPDYDTWEGQAGNEGKSFQDYSTARDTASAAYTDKRTDARIEWQTRRTERENVARAAAARADEEVRAHVDRIATLKQTRQDFDDVLEKANVEFPKHIAPLVIGRFMKSPLSAHLMLHLAEHPDDVAALNGIPAPPDESATSIYALNAAFGTVFGAIERTVKAASAAAPTDKTGGAPPAPNKGAPPQKVKPTSDAPAPLSAVPGGTTGTRTLSQLAADDEDADEYLAQTHPELLKGR